MKFSKLVGLVVTVCAFLTACEEKKTGNERTLTVGVSADYAPFEFFKDGKMVGFDIDLMNEIGKRLNKEINFKDMSFDAILGSLSTNRIDAAISSITPTNQRRKSVDFSNEYIKSKRILVCKATSSIESASDLASETIGVQSGSEHETYANSTLTEDVNVKVKSLTKVPDLIQDMEIGNVSCLILGIAEAEAIKESRPNIKLINLPGEVQGFSIAFPKGSPLKDQVNEILAAMEADKSLDALKERWLPHDAAP